MSFSIWRVLVVVAPIAVGCGSFGNAPTSIDGGAYSNADGAAGDAATGDCSLVVQHTDTTFQLGGYSVKVNGDAGGVVEHSDEDRTESPDGGGSLRALMPSGAGRDREAQVSKIFDIAPAKVRLKFATKVSATGSASAGCVLVLRGSEDQADRLEVQSSVSAGQLGFDVMPFTNHILGVATRAEDVGAADLTTWYQIVYEVSSISATSAHVRISVDGTSKLDTDVALSKAPTAIRLKCGIDEIEDEVGAEAFVDELELAACSP